MTKIIQFSDPEFHFLSNFSAFAVHIYGNEFQTAEAAYQHEKFAEYPEIQLKILRARNPWEVKEISDAHKKFRPKNWDALKLPAMMAIIHAKYDQHKYIRENLPRTGNAELQELNTKDEFWATGSRGTGKNHLGWIWMNIREDAKQLPDPDEEPVKYLGAKALDAAREFTRYNLESITDRFKRK